MLHELLSKELRQRRLSVQNELLSQKEKQIEM